MSSVFKQFLVVSVALQLSIAFLAWVFVIPPEAAALGGLLAQVVLTSCLISELKRMR